MSITLTKRDGKLNSSKIDLDKIDYNKLIIDDFEELKNLPTNTQIYLSTILGLKTKKDINKVIELKKLYNITDICPHHDFMFQQDISDLVSELKNAKINPILLVNESCSYNCSYRKNHYDFAGFSQKEDYFQKNCVDHRTKHPETLVDMTGFIHPNIIEQFSNDTGVDSFKIVGRNKSPDCIKKKVNAYTALEIPNNLLDIIVYTSAEDKFFIDSKSLSKKTLYKYTKKRRLSLGKQLVNEGKIQVSKFDEIVNNDLDEIKLWDKVYENDYLSLPWYGINLSTCANEFLNKLNIKDKIIVPGCGVGDIPKKIYDAGFLNISTNDISQNAINTASKRFSEINFNLVSTQEIYKFGINDAIGFDWMNLHDIKPEKLGMYLSSLQNTCHLLYISYLYDSKIKKIESSVEHNITVFHHNPKLIQMNLSKMDLVLQNYFSILSNPNLNEVKEYGSVSKIYVKK